MIATIVESMIFVNINEINTAKIPTNKKTTQSFFVKWYSPAIHE